MLERFAAKLTLNAATIALIVLALVIQTARIEGFKVWPISVKGYKADAAELRAQIKTLTDARNEQAERTEGNIGKARDRRSDADPKARRIETTPLPGNCRTPDAILEMDI